MNIGLVGYGFMGAAHAAAIAVMPGVTLKAVASRTRPGTDAPTRGNIDLKTVPLPASVNWYPGWHSLVRDPTIDAVDICLPTHLHKQVILSAFQHGKHVLCEKPMALTSEDCDDLLEAAASVNRIFMVAQVLRFLSPYRHALAFIRSAQLIRSCILRRATGYPQWSPWLSDKACSGGAILDLLSHDLDQALLWFGAPRAVSAVACSEIDTVRATLTYPDGLKVTVKGGWLIPEAPFSQSFDIQAEDGSLAFAKGKLHETRRDGTQVIDIPEQDPYTEEILYFLACCRNGEAPERCLPRASADAVRLAILVRRSREQEGKELAWA